MTAAELIQVLMKEENIDKDIVIVEPESNTYFDVEGVTDISSEIKLEIRDVPQECEHADCECGCTMCENCEYV